MSIRGPSKPTGGVTEYRRPLFAVSRVAVVDGGAAVILGGDTWGRVRVVRGGVTQKHRELLDIIRTVAEYRIIDAVGQEHLIFDDAEVRRLMGKKIAWKDVHEDLLDMLGTVLQEGSKTPGSWGKAYQIATWVGDANSDAHRLPHQFPAKLRRLVLSTDFTAHLHKQASVHYSLPVLKRVLALGHAVSKAVARWCLTHSHEQHHDLAAVLVAVGAVREGEPIAGRAARWQARNYVRQLRDDADGLGALGIAIADGRLHYHRQPGVFFSMSDHDQVVAETQVTTPPVVAKTQVVVAETQVVVAKTQVSNPSLTPTPRIFPRIPFITH
jgi:hypothetical protein